MTNKTESQIAAQSFVRRNYPLYSDQDLLIPIFVAGWEAKPSLEWIKIDPKNLPKGRVLGKWDGMEENVEPVIGIIEPCNSPQGDFCCRSDIYSGGIDTAWSICTHYIPLEQLLSLPKQK